MTPLDIEMKEFSKGIAGYNTAEVDAFLDEISHVLGDLKQEKVELTNKVERLTEKLEHYKTIEKTLQDTMILAETTSRKREVEANKAAEKIILEGTFKSDRMVEKARQEVYTIKQNMDNLQKQYKTAKVQMKQMLQNQLEILESDNNDILQGLTNNMPEEEEEVFKTSNYEKPSKAEEITSFEEEEKTTKEENSFEDTNPFEELAKFEGTNPFENLGKFEETNTFEETSVFEEEDDYDEPVSFGEQNSFGGFGGFGESGGFGDSKSISTPPLNAGAMDEDDFNNKEDYYDNEEFYTKEYQIINEEDII